MSTIIQKPRRRLIRELPAELRPTTRLRHVGSDQLSITELIAIVLNTTDALDLAEEIVCQFTIEDLPQTTLSELQLLHGIGPSRASSRSSVRHQLLAAIELGRRLVNYRSDHPKIKSPKDAADILMPKLKHKQQEHFIVIPINTKNRILDMVWLYKGTLNSSVLRVGEIYRQAIRRQAAAIIVAHNHPSGAPRSA